MEAGDRVAVEQLEKLCENDKLRELLCNKHLRDYLVKVNSNPTKEIDKAMKEPIFLEFANECLKMVEPDRFQVD
ncbi:ZNHIT3 [Bugula neritina]|uniref:ZNHIT3 n=1 Tax=Bugula neritina TaxID=10212 RepID=A0A7J7JXI7_BUGNE|nr:ZNHIT3 [Bugula neritina]